MPDQVVEQIPVPFSGEGAGTEKMTWGQYAIWQSIVVSGQSRTVSGISTLPPGTTLQDVADNLRHAVCRHQSLRTRYQFVPGSRTLETEDYPLQVCAAEGVLTLDVVDAGDDDPGEVAQVVLLRCQTEPFDYEHEWPLRMTVIRAGGVPTHLIAVYLHLSVDAGALEVLIADDALAQRHDTAEPVTAMQPLEQSRWQWGPAGQRHTQGAQRYLENVLRTVPMSRFGEPRDDGPARFAKIKLRSPAMALAMHTAAVGCRTNTSSVLLASFAVALVRVVGRNPVMAMLTVSNRFRPRLAESVSTLAQVLPYMIDVGDGTIGEAVRRAGQSTLSAYKNAYFDPNQHDAVYHRVFAERGGPVDLSCYYNDRRQRTVGVPTGDVPTAEEITTALAATTEDWVDDPEMPASTLYLYVADPPEAIELQVSSDLRHLPADELRAVVREMEAVTVAAALDPESPISATPTPTAALLSS